MSSLSSTAVNRDTTAVDYLNYLRQYASSQQALNSAGSNITQDYILQLSDVIDITDTLVLGSVESLANTIDITDTVTQTSQTTGTFLIDTAKIDFSDLI